MESTAVSVEVPYRLRDLAHYSLKLEAPVKLTTFRRFKLTRARRFKLTTPGRSKLTT